MLRVSGDGRVGSVGWRSVGRLLLPLLLLLLLLQLLLLLSLGSQVRHRLLYLLLGRLLDALVSQVARRLILPGRQQRASRVSYRRLRSTSMRTVSSAEGGC